MYTQLKCLVFANTCFTVDGKLRTNHRYFAKCPLRMWLLDVQKCEFVTWTTKGIYVCKVKADIDFQNNMVDSCTGFWRKHIVPELHTRSMQCKLENKENIQKLYCFCRQPYDKIVNGDMIGCDGRDCPNAWVHFSCAKRKTAPRGTWYCRDCKGKKLRK